MALSSVHESGVAMRGGNIATEVKGFADPSSLLARWGVVERNADKLTTIRDVLFRGACAIKWFRVWRQNIAWRIKRRTEQRDRVLRLVASGVEGDIRFYSIENLRKREHLRYHPEIKQLLDKWFDLLGEKSREHGSVVYQDMYKAFHNRISSVLVVKSLSQKERLHLFARDWFIDTGGRPERYHLSRRQFVDAIYVMADLWTEGVERSKYSRFLRAMLMHVEDSVRVVRARRTATKFDPSRANGEALWGRMRAQWAQGAGSAVTKFLKGVRSQKETIGVVGMQSSQHAASILNSASMQKPIERSGSESAFEPTGPRHDSADVHQVGTDSDAPTGHMVSSAADALQALIAQGVVEALDTREDSDGSVDSVRSEGRRRTGTRQSRGMSRDGKLMPPSLFMPGSRGFEGGDPDGRSPDAQDRLLRSAGGSRVLVGVVEESESAVKGRKGAYKRQGGGGSLVRKPSVNMLSGMEGGEGGYDRGLQLKDFLNGDAGSPLHRATHTQSFMIPTWQRRGLQEGAGGQDSTAQLAAAVVNASDWVQDTPMGSDEDEAREETVLTFASSTEGSAGKGMRRKGFKQALPSEGGGAAPQSPSSPTEEDAWWRTATPLHDRTQVSSTGSRAASGGGTQSAQASTPVPRDSVPDEQEHKDEQLQTPQSASSHHKSLKKRHRQRFRGTRGMALRGDGELTGSDSAGGADEEEAEADDGDTTAEEEAYDAQGRRVRRLHGADSLGASRVARGGGDHPSDSDELHDPDDTSSLESSGDEQGDNGREGGSENAQSPSRRHRRTSSLETVRASIAKAQAEARWGMGLDPSDVGAGGLQHAAGDDDDEVAWDFGSGMPAAVSRRGGMSTSTTKNRWASGDAASAHTDSTPKLPAERESFTSRIKREQAALQRKAQKRAKDARGVDAARLMLQRTQAAEQLASAADQASLPALQRLMARNGAPSTQTRAVPGSDGVGQLPWWARGGSVKQASAAVGAVGGGTEARRRHASRNASRGSEQGEEATGPPVRTHKGRELAPEDVLVVPSYIVQEPLLPGGDDDDALSVFSQVTDSSSGLEDEDDGSAHAHRHKRRSKGARDAQWMRMPPPVAVQTLSPAASAVALALQPAAGGNDDAARGAQSRINTVALALAGGGWLPLRKLKSFHAAMMPTQPLDGAEAAKPLPSHSQIEAVYAASAAQRPHGVRSSSAHDSLPREHTIQGEQEGCVGGGGSSTAHRARRVLAMVARRSASAPGALSSLTSRYLSKPSSRGASRGSSRGHFRASAAEHAGGAGEDTETLAFLLLAGRVDPEAQARDGLPVAAQPPVPPVPQPRGKAGGALHADLESAAAFRVHIRPGGGEQQHRQALKQMDGARPTSPLDEGGEGGLLQSMRGADILRSFAVPDEDQEVDRNTTGGLTLRTEHLGTSRAFNGRPEQGEEPEHLPAWLGQMSTQEALAVTPSAALRRAASEQQAGQHSTLRKLQAQRRKAAAEAGVGMDGHAPEWVKQRYRSTAQGGDDEGGVGGLPSSPIVRGPIGSAVREQAAAAAPRAARPAPAAVPSTAGQLKPRPPPRGPVFHSDKRGARKRQAALALQQNSSLRLPFGSAESKSHSDLVREQFAAGAKDRLMGRLSWLDSVNTVQGGEQSARDRDAADAMMRVRKRNKPFQPGSAGASLALPPAMDVGGDHGDEGLFLLEGAEENDGVAPWGDGSGVSTALTAQLSALRSVATAHVVRFHPDTSGAAGAQAPAHRHGAGIAAAGGSVLPEGGVLVREYPVDMLHGPAGQHVISLSDAAGTEADDEVGAVIVLRGGQISFRRSSDGKPLSPFDLAALMLQQGGAGGLDTDGGVKSMWLTRAIEAALITEGGVDSPGGGSSSGGLSPAARAAIMSLLQAATQGRRLQGAGGGADTLVIIGRGLLTNVMGRLAQSRSELLQRDRYNLAAGSPSLPLRGASRGGLMEAASAADLSFAGGMYAQASAGGFSSAHVGSMMGVHSSASAASLLLTGGVIEPPPTHWGRGMRGTALLEQSDAQDAAAQAQWGDPAAPSAASLPYAMQQHVEGGGVAGHSRLPAPAPLLSIHSWGGLRASRGGLEPRPPPLVAGTDLGQALAPPPRGLSGGGHRSAVSRGAVSRLKPAKRPDTRQSHNSAPGDAPVEAAPGPSLGGSASSLRRGGGGDPLPGRRARGPLRKGQRKVAAKQGMLPAMSLGSVPPGEWSLLAGDGAGQHSIEGLPAPGAQRSSSTLAAAGQNLVST